MPSGSGRASVPTTVKRAASATLEAPVPKKSMADPKTSGGAGDGLTTPKPKKVSTALQSSPGGGSRASVGSTKPSASFTKQVQDSLKRIRSRESVSTPGAPSESTPVVSKKQASMPIHFTLPPKVVPKAFAPRSVPADSMEGGHTQLSGDSGRRAPSDDESEHYIDADTGRLTLKKRKITSQPLEPFVIPLKKKKPLSGSPQLVEPLYQPVASPEPSPTGSDVAEGEQEEQYTFLEGNDPDEL